MSPEKEIAAQMRLALVDKAVRKPEAQWRPIPEYGDLFTVEQFKEMCDSGCLINSDGSGEYATETACSRVEALPSDFKRGIINRDYTHVVWYNK